MYPGSATKIGVAITTPTSATTAVQTARIDAGGEGAAYVTLVVNLSAEKNTDATGVVLALSHSDTTHTSGTNLTTVVANRTEDLTTAHGVVYHVPMKGKRRYLVLVATPDTTTNGNVCIGSSYVLSKLTDRPANTTDMQISTNDVFVMVS